MSERKIKHATDCPGCGVDLTQPDMVRIHIAVGEEAPDISYGCIEEDGRIRNTEDGIVRLDFRVGGRREDSYCASCDAQLPELDSSGEPVSLRWYVRTECGDVRGPMSQKDAEFESGRLDGAIMFDERIFEPEFVTTEETELLLRDLKGMEDGKDDGIGKLSRRAIDTITLLSKKSKLRFIMPKEIANLIVDLGVMESIVSRSRCSTDDATTILSLCDEGNLPKLLKRAIDALVSHSRELSEDVSSLVSWLLEQNHACPTDEENHGSDWIRNMKVHDENMKNVAETLVRLSREKVVTGSIEGGVLNLGEVPEGVTVDIRDFDVDGVDPGLLKTDEDGNTYFEVG